MYYQEKPIIWTIFLGVNYWLEWIAHAVSQPDVIQEKIVVTASVNHVAFNKSVPVGSVLTIEAKVSRAFKSSMEIFADVWIEDRETGLKTKVNEGIYTFVAVDQTGKPVEIDQIIPESDLEKERFEGALRRKQLSLILAGKLNPADATELKALFA